MNSEITVYRKNGLTFIRYSALYEGMSNKDFAKMIGKDNTTILRHYKKIFPFLAIRHGVKMTLTIEEQETLIKTFPNFELVRQATRIPLNAIESCKNATELCRQKSGKALDSELQIKK
jgi:hypothetical protein